MPVTACLRVPQHTCLSSSKICSTASRSDSDCGQLDSSWLPILSEHFPSHCQQVDCAQSVSVMGPPRPAVHSDPHEAALVHVEADPCVSMDLHGVPHAKVFNLDGSAISLLATPSKAWTLKGRARADA
eukprot:4894996-Amphidinium_carterae.1